MVAKQALNLVDRFEFYRMLKILDIYTYEIVALSSSKGKLVIFTNLHEVYLKDLDNYLDRNRYPGDYGKIYGTVGTHDITIRKEIDGSLVDFNSVDIKNLRKFFADKKAVDIK